MSLSAPSSLLTITPSYVKLSVFVIHSPCSWIGTYCLLLIHITSFSFRCWLSNKSSLLIPRAEWTWSVHAFASGTTVMSPAKSQSSSCMVKIHLLSEVVFLMFQSMKIWNMPVRASNLASLLSSLQKGKNIIKWMQLCLLITTSYINNYLHGWKKICHFKGIIYLVWCLLFHRKENKQVLLLFNLTL